MFNIPLEPERPKTPETLKLATPLVAEPTASLPELVTPSNLLKVVLVFEAALIPLNVNIGSLFEVPLDKFKVSPSKLIIPPVDVIILVSPFKIPFSIKKSLGLVDSTANLIAVPRDVSYLISPSL